MASNVTTRQSVYPVLVYRDAEHAVSWLRDAFGFEAGLTVPGENGGIVHAELSYRGSIVMLGGKPGEAETGGSSCVYIVVDDVDAHYRRAVAAGAAIEREPHDTDYGSRDYAARDPEGNTWYFGTYCP